MVRAHNWFVISLWMTGFIAAIFADPIVALCLWAYPAVNAAANAAIDLNTGCIRWRD